MININLVKDTTTRKKKLGSALRPEILVGLAVVLAVVGVLLWYWMLMGERQETLHYKSELEEKSLQLNALRAQIARFEEQRAELEGRTRVIEDLKSTQRGPVQMMNSIIGSIPDEPRLWLSQLTQEDQTVTIQGQAFDVPAIADFVSSLGNTPAFQSVELDYWEEGEESVMFELNCVLESGQHVSD
jgi:Tfp pilus assembly protein PilN